MSVGIVSFDEYLPKAESAAAQSSSLKALQSSLIIVKAGMVLGASLWSSANALDARDIEMHTGSKVWSPLYWLMIKAY
jgi:hypothetical protein